LSEEWCITRGFLDVAEEEEEEEEDNKNPNSSWTLKPISDMVKFATPLADNIIDASSTCAEVLQKMRSTSIDTVLLFKEGVMAEVVTKKNIMSKLVLGVVKPTDSVELAALDRYILVGLSTLH
jgi:hypothetical protein